MTTTTTNTCRCGKQGYSTKADAKHARRAAAARRANGPHNEVRYYSDCAYSTTAAPVWHWTSQVGTPAPTTWKPRPQPAAADLQAMLDWQPGAFRRQR